MKLFLPLVFFLLALSAEGQNLFINGSFENYIPPCPPSAANGDFHAKVYNWYTGGPYPGIGYPTVDLYCGQLNYCNQGPPGKIGSDGLAYAGFHTRVYTPFYNEMIYQVLSTPLVAGQKYFLTVSLMTCQDGLNGTDNFHVYSNIDSLFPICPPDSPSVQLLGIIPNSSISKTQWSAHSLSFIAPANCNVIIFTGDCTGNIDETYYFVDNAILVNCGTTEFSGTDAFICDGDSILLAGGWRNVAGSYNDTLTAISGCDSIIINTLTIKQSYLTSVSSAICLGDSIFLEGNYQKIAGTYYDTLTATNGCDSIIETNLSLSPVYSTALQASICNGDSIFLQQNFQTSAGNYYDTLASMDGCDSLLITTLSVNQTFLTSLSIEICSGGSLFAGGNYQINSGTYYDTLTTVSGCDSIITTNLSVLPQIADTQNLFICSDDSIFIGGNYQNSAGNYVDTLISAKGCDSILTTNLSILQEGFSTQSISICNGDSIFLSGNWQKIPGIYYDTISAINGCDSVIETTLTINSVFGNQYSVSICNGDSIFLQGNFQTTAGIYYDTLTAINGCDSIIETDLTVKLDISSSQNLSICNGDSVLVNENWQSTNGTYYDTLTATNGCDSIIAINLAVLPEISSSQNLSICNGDSVLINGNWQSTNGTYYDTLTATNSCDSIIAINLAVLSEISSSQSLSICTGDSIFIGGNWQNTNGTYIDTLTAANGCDSIVTILLFLLSNSASNQTISICDGDSVFIQSNWQNTSGTYHDTLTAVNGCDSIIKSILNILSNTTASRDISICENDSIFIGGNWQKLSGTYYDTLNSSNGCDSIMVTTLKTDSLPMAKITSTDSVVCFGESAILTASGGKNYLWNSGETLATITISPQNAALYSVKVTNDNNCSDTDTLTIEIEDDCAIMLPEIFSPNGDGANDKLFVRGRGVKSFHLVIYNRWGEKVFETDDFNNGWDGTYKGKASDPAVFVYFLSGYYNNGSEIKQKGNVSLMR